MKKSSSPRYKGKVGVVSDKGALRLNLPRFLFGGKQRHIYLHLPDTPENRKLAEAKAMQIESDIKYERFDHSLDRYRPTQPSAPDPKIKVCTTARVLGDWVESRSPYVKPGTKANYQKSVRLLARSPFGGLPVNNVGKREVARFLDWLTENSSQSVAIQLLKHLNTACNWAEGREDISGNPWSGTVGRLKKQMETAKDDRDIDPLSVFERDFIIQGFLELHPEYAAFVQFLFFTGCRPSEAIGLDWNQVGEQTITFLEAVVEDERGRSIRKDGLKTQKRRTFPINPQLQEILELASSRSGRTGIVFPNPSGQGYIDRSNFRKAWKAVLADREIRYRKPYQTRHTFITQCLERGIPHATVAKWVGNSSTTIFKFYAGPGVGATVPNL